MNTQHVNPAIGYVRDGAITDCKSYKSADVLVCNAFAKELLRVFYYDWTNHAAMKTLFSKLGSKEREAFRQLLFPRTPKDVCDNIFPTVADITNALLTT